MSGVSWRKDAQVYLQPRVWMIFVLGVASGFPQILIGSVLSAWLQESGISRSQIGFVTGVATVYALNALWSPLVDRVKLPLLTRWLGQRRSWLILCQSLIALGCILLSTFQVVDNLWLIGLAGLLIAFASATQDIAIDAFRIESFAPEESRLQSAGAAMATAGWWTGFSGLGALPFFLVDGSSTSWTDVYLILAGVMLSLSLLLFFFREPAAQNLERHAEILADYQQRVADYPKFIGRMAAWVGSLIVAPIADFFNRNGTKLALSLLLFIFLFKIGEAFLGRMSIVFYKEIGFSNDDIAVYSKLVNWWVTIFFAILGSFVNLRLGIVKGLMIGGVAMAASNLMFSWIALSGPSTHLLLSAVIIDGFTSAWSTVAFVAFISLLCDRAFTATQYALLVSLGTMSRMLLASYSGVVIDTLDGNWNLFFILTALMVLPSLLFLWSIRHSLTELERRSHAQ